jgi:hypothetical protein
MGTGEKVTITMSALKECYGNGFFEVGPEFGFLPKAAPLIRYHLPHTLRGFSSSIQPSNADFRRNTLSYRLSWMTFPCGRTSILANTAFWPTRYSLHPLLEASSPHTISQGAIVDRVAALPDILDKVGILWRQTCSCFKPHVVFSG